MASWLLSGLKLWVQENATVDTIWLERWYAGNCASDSNLTIEPIFLKPKQKKYTKLNNNGWQLELLLLIISFAFTYKNIQLGVYIFERDMFNQHHCIWLYADTFQEKFPMSLSL